MIINNQWVNERINNIKNGQIESFHRWEIPSELWSQFLAIRNLENRKMIKGVIFWVSLIGILILLFAFRSELHLIKWWIISLSTGLGFGLLIAGLIMVNHKNQAKRLNSSNDGIIFFSEKEILMNNQLIYFNQMNNYLEYIKIITIDNLNLLSLKITTNAGGKSNSNIYLIPIPENKHYEAEAIIAKYCDNIK